MKKFGMTRRLPGGETGSYQFEAHKFANDRLSDDGFVIFQILLGKASIELVHHPNQTIGNLALKMVNLF